MIEIHPILLKSLTAKDMLAVTQISHTKFAEYDANWKTMRREHIRLK